MRLILPEISESRYHEHIDPVPDSSQGYKSEEKGTIVRFMNKGVGLLVHLCETFNSKSRCPPYKDPGFRLPYNYCCYWISNSTYIGTRSESPLSKAIGLSISEIRA